MYARFYSRVYYPRLTLRQVSYSESHASKSRGVKFAPNTENTKAGASHGYADR
jgi:hypothetical protein